MAVLSMGGRLAGVLLRALCRVILHLGEPTIATVPQPRVLTTKGQGLTSPSKRATQTSNHVAD